MKSFRYLFIAILCGMPAADVSSKEKPNVIIIYADDMGYGDCTVNNPESMIPTPNIDRLAKEGLRFTRAFARYDLYRFALRAAHGNQSGPARCR